MAMTDLTEWRWGTIVPQNGGRLFLDIGNNATVQTISLPRICSINMVLGVIIIEERFMKKNNEDGDQFALSLHLASEDAIKWVTTQLVERAKSPY